MKEFNEYKAIDNLALRAAIFAHDAHNGQVRKYTKAPYITHPQRVACRASNLDGTYPELIAAAWLHDVVEDTEITNDDIRFVFGNIVAELVRGLTNPSKRLTLPRAARKAMDRDHIAKQSYDVRRLKMLDRIDNLKEMTEAPLDFIELYLDESRLLAEVLRDTDKVLLNELEEAIAKLSGTFGYRCHWEEIKVK